MKKTRKKVNQGKKKRPSGTTPRKMDSKIKPAMHTQTRDSAAEDAGKTKRMPSTLTHAKEERVLRVKLQWRQIVREHRAHHFPESDRGIAELFLFIMGVLPLIGSRIHERAQFRRIRAAVGRSGRVHAWLEGRRIHPAAFMAVAGSIAALVLFFSFYTFGTTVTYQGKVIATTTSPLAVKSACSDLEKVTEQALDKKYSLNIDQLKYTSKLMARKDVTNAADFEESLSAEIGKVTYGYVLYIDGEMIGATPYKGALEELLQQLKDDVADENTLSCTFRENVQIKAEYVPNSRIMNLGYLAETLYSTKKKETTYTIKAGDTWSEIAEAHEMSSKELLAMNPGFDVDKLQIGEVLTLSAAAPYLTMTVVEKETYKEVLPFEVQYVDSAYLFKGDTKVVSPGKNGSADVVAKVTYVNGEETKRDVLSYIKRVAPVTEKQARGTKERPTWTATGMFRWPCSGNVTSKFGYRHLSYSYASTYHKGIDIANRRGTPIYAADGGTVTYAGWMSGYGYLVIINHGNGYETYYGHNSDLLASVGQHVYQGQQIAKMGSTGNSTGNHCHFGVYYNGVPKNPINYL